MLRARIGLQFVRVLCAVTVLQRIFRPWRNICYEYSRTGTFLRKLYAIRRYDVAIRLLRK